MTSLWWWIQRIKMQKSPQKTVCKWMRAVNERYSALSFLHEPLTYFVHLSICIDRPLWRLQEWLLESKYELGGCHCAVNWYIIPVTCKHCAQGFVLCQLHVGRSVALTLTATMAVWESAVSYVVRFSMGYHAMDFPSLEQLGWMCCKCSEENKLDGCIGLTVFWRNDMWPFRLVPMLILLRFVDIEY